MNPAPPARGDKSRLFLALWPDEAARRAVAAWQARWSWPAGAAVVPAERLHLTLHFIGPVARERLPEITPALARPCPRFEIAFGAAECWPRGLALLMPASVPPALLELHERLAQALSALDLPVEARPFRPHLTLARKAAGALPPPEPAVLPWPVAGYALVVSDRGYRTLARYGA